MSKDGVKYSTILHCVSLLYIVYSYITLTQILTPNLPKEMSIYRMKIKQLFCLLVWTKKTSAFNLLTVGC